MASERKFALWREWSFSFIRCLSLEWLLVSTKQFLQFLQPSFSFLTAAVLDLIGFCSISRNCLTQYDQQRRWNSRSSYHWYIHWAPAERSNYLLNAGVVFFFPFSWALESVLLPVCSTFIFFSFWLKRHFLIRNKSASHVQVLALPVGNSVIQGVGSHFSGTLPPRHEWRVGSMLVLYKGSYPHAPNPSNTLPDFDEQSDIKWQALFPGWLSKNDIN